MKKILILLLSLALILSLVACGGNDNDIDNPPDETQDQGELPDEDLNGEDDEDDEDDEEDDDGSIGSSGYNPGDHESYVTFSDAYYEFTGNITDNASKSDEVLYGQVLVLSPEMHVFDYLLPLMLFGETLEDMEIQVQDEVLKLFIGEGKTLVSAEAERISDNKYVMTTARKDGKEFIGEVEYFPNIDATRLITTEDGEMAMLFEYTKNKDGYAAQYYFNQPMGGSYGQEPIKKWCVYRYMFSGLEGSCARFDDVGEPATIIGDVPGEEEFIDGATHWVTITNDEFTGELDGVSF